MITTIYRVGDAEFNTLAEAQEFESNANRELYLFDADGNRLSNVPESMENAIYVYMSRYGQSLFDGLCDMAGMDTCNSSIGWNIWNNNKCEYIHLDHDDVANLVKAYNVVNAD